MGLRSILAVALLTGAALLMSWSVPRSADAGEEDVVLSIGDDDVEVEDFLRALTKATGVQMLWKPSDPALRGRKIVGNLELRAKSHELLGLVRGLLCFYDLVMVPIGPPSHQIQLVRGIDSATRMTALKPTLIELTNQNLGLYDTKDGLYVNTTMHVEHVRDLKALRQDLHDVMREKKASHVFVLPRAHALSVTGFAPDVVAVYRLLAEIDRRGPVRERMAAIDLEHADAFEVAANVQRHFAAKLKGASAPVITADDRTNRVLVSGTPPEVEAVRAATRLLDVPVPATDVEAHLIRLRHLDAAETAEVLTDLVASSAGLWREKGEAPGVVAHARMNALVIGASPETFARIRRFVAQLDSE
jgi:type II secretory pathway component GspD/PulD (secretin)